MTASDQEQAGPTKSNTRGITIIVALAGIAAALGPYTYISSLGPENDDIVMPERIDVSGKVSAGPDRIPNSLLFYDETHGETETVSFEGTHYSIDLPNGNYDWQITVLWFGVTDGECDGGRIAYQMTTSATLLHDISCID